MGLDHHKSRWKGIAKTPVITQNRARQAWAVCVMCVSERYFVQAPVGKSVCDEDQFQAAGERGFATPKHSSDPRAGHRERPSRVIFQSTSAARVTRNPFSHHLSNYAEPCPSLQPLSNYTPELYFFWSYFIFFDLLLRPPELRAHSFPILSPGLELDLSPPGSLDGPIDGGADCPDAQVRGRAAPHRGDLSTRALALRRWFRACSSSFAEGIGWSWPNASFLFFSFFHF